MIRTPMLITCRIAAVVLVVSWQPAAVSALELDGGRSMTQVRRTVIATVISEAPIYLDAKVTRTPLITAPPGTSLEVLQQSGDWVQVQFTDRTFGRRVGWVEARHVRFEQPEVSGPTPAEQQRARQAPPLMKTPMPPQVLIDQPRSRFERGWLDVNVGFAVASERSYNVRSERLQFDETATFEAAYDFPFGGIIEAAGGVMLTRALGVGVGVSRAVHTDLALVRATIPHPLRFNAFGIGEADTEEELRKSERAIHFQGTFMRTVSPNLRYRVFAGPTYFNVSQETIASITFSQAFQVTGTGNEITIIGTPLNEVDETAWGFHVGADVSWFTTRTAGVGASARFSRATVELPDLGGALVEHKAGGFQAGVGLRLKF
jgi:hypothetical protein